MPSPGLATEPSCGPAHRQVAERFAISARLYAEAVVNLTRPFSNGGHQSHQELERLAAAVESARLRCEQDRVAFERTNPPAAAILK
jgi:hypothetical protein